MQYAQRFMNAVTSGLLEIGEAIIEYDDYIGVSRSGMDVGEEWIMLMFTDESGLILDTRNPDQWEYVVVYEGMDEAEFQALKTMARQFPTLAAMEKAA